MLFSHREMPRLLVVALALAWAAILADDFLAMVVAAPPAATTEWVGAPEDPGSWFDSSNWSDGVPDASDVAEIADGGEAGIRRGRAEAESLRLVRGPYLNTPNNHIRQSGGRLWISNELSIEDGRYDLERGHLSTGSLRLGRFPLPTLWPPIVIPSADTPVLFETPQQTILLSLEETATEIETDVPELMHELVDPDWPFLIFRLPVQQFHQSGGRTNIDQRLSIYSGGVQVSGGRLYADSILIDSRGIFGSIVPDDSESDRPPVSGMEQSGGSVRVTDELLIQNNSYRLSGGTLRVDRIAIGDPAMENSLVFFFNRLPEFIQTGGLNIVTGDLELCLPGFNIIPFRPFQAVNYRLEGGTLRVGGDAIVGSLGAAPANFLQSAGRARIGGTLRIEGDSSRYEISGGRLSTENLEIGLGIFNTGGTFAITEPAPGRGWLSFLRSEQVTVYNRFSLGEESVFEAVPGSRMRLAGGKFENFSTHDENLAGLNNLELIIGDTIWNLFRASTAQVTEFEVGGLDLGNVDEGYVENFALDTLRVGGLRPAHLRLVDLVDNQPNSGSPEALYVDHLVVGRGSTLDLGGIPIYYRTARIFGNVINAAQALASISQVPEPSSALLLFVGSAMWAGARKRAWFPLA